MAKVSAKRKDVLQQFTVFELPEHDGLAMEVYGLVRDATSSLPERPWGQVPLSTRVSLALLARLSNDLRCTALLTQTGYPLQALTLTAASYEVAYGMAYIGVDDTWAQVWRDHDDPGRMPFGSVYDLTVAGMRKLEIPNAEERAREEYETLYRILCQGKHANPLLQRRFGHRVNAFAQEVISENGPDTSDFAIQSGWFALESSIALTLIGIRSFIMNHVPSEQRAALLDRCDALADRRVALADTARRRWRS